MATSIIKKPTGVTYVLNSMTDVTNLYGLMKDGDTVLVSLSAAFNQTLGGRNMGSGTAFRAGNSTIDLTYKAGDNMMYLARIANGTVSSFKKLYFTDTDDNMFLIKAYSLSVAWAVDEAKNFTADDFGVATPSGYIPLCARMFNSGNSRILISRISSSAVGTSTFLTAKNSSSSPLTYTITVHIVYVKSGLVTVL